MNLARPTAVIWDWDGTIVDSLPAIFAAFNEVMALYSKPPITLETALEAMAKGAGRDILGHIVPEDPEGAYEKFHPISALKRLEILNPIAGAHDFISWLHANHIPQAVVSNVRQENLEREVGKLGWSALFQSLVGFRPGIPGKPAPDLVFLALDQMGIARDRTANIWFMGDMATDAGAARAAGCRFVQFIGGDGAHQKPRLAAEHQFDDYGTFRDQVHALLVLG